MAADPVIIDDGGSTRIKQDSNTSNMDGLLDNRRDNAQGKFSNVAGTLALCKVFVQHLGRDGAARPGAPVAVNVGDIVEIVSDGGQVTTVELRPNFRLQIIVAAAAGGGADPILDARHNNGKRRYVVTNAGVIKTVTLGGVALFPPAAGADSIYTMVHFSNT